MHVVLINHFYPPAQAPTGLLLQDVALALRDRGHGVTVISSAGLYGKRSTETPFKRSDGITLYRLGPRGASRTGLISKTLDYLGFWIRARRAIRNLVERPDAFLCTTTPPFCASLAAGSFKQAHIPCLIWCMDLYPEALVAGGLLSRCNPVYVLLARRARIERSQAATVISLSADMTQRLQQSAVSARIEEIPVWSNLRVTPQNVAEAQSLRRARSWSDDERILLYSGNLGRAHRAEEFAALAHRLRAVGAHARIVFSGHGPSKRVWQRRWSGLFEWMDWVDEDRLGPHLLAADIHLVSQQSGWEGVVAPSKYQAACALGRPVVFAGSPHSAVARWILEDRTGWVLPIQDDQAVSAVAREISDSFVIQAKAKRALAQSARLFNGEAARQKIVEIIESVKARAS